MRQIITSIAITLLLTGCATVADHKQAVSNDADSKLTLGTAQRTIKEGMSQGDVLKALGSPNMATKDRAGVETWVYDKFSTDTAYSTSAGGVAGLVIGSGGAGIGSGSQSSGATSRTQRTLTIIIKFENSAVKEFTYNATAF